MSYWTLKLLGGLLLSNSQQAVAQSQTGVPLWPEVPALLGGGPREVVAAIHRRLVYPPEARMACVTGRVFVAFDITPAGSVRQAKVVKPLWEPFGSAAVRAVRQLRFQSQPLQAGDIRYVVPVRYQYSEAAPTVRKAARHH